MGKFRITWEVDLPSADNSESALDTALDDVCNTTGIAELLEVVELDRYGNVKPSTKVIYDLQEDVRVLFYGGCGVANCVDCLPKYDLDNNPIPEEN